MAVAAASQNIPECLLPSQGRRQREQVAAVCYRVGACGVEFLLVRTRGGRWTFPKGRIEPGLSYAQSAALEAFEEAGVHGRIELAAFARYLRPASSKSPRKSTLVLAYLCEVRLLDEPQERRRNRTWFTVEKAKRRLREGRTSECGGELAAVVDRAVARVGRLRGRSEARATGQDALQRVCLEASSLPALQQKAASAAVSCLRRRRAHCSQGIEVAIDAHLQRLLPAPGQEAVARVKG